nr:uncharacterized mitochondrial protein AtMg00810-like [Tanacetum cinerariifolium]
MKAITTRSSVAYEGPLIPTNSSPKKVVERETEETTDKEQTNFQGSTAHIQPPITPIPEPDVSKTLPKPNIPYPSRFNDQKLREKATNQMEKFFQIFQNLHFDISFVDALLLMPKFASTIKSLLANKDKLFELAKILLNENFSAMLLKKLGDPGKFLIPCDFSRMDSKYVLEILKKYGMESCDPVGTPMEIKDKLDLDQNGTPAKPTEKHLKEVKRIFRYLRGTVNTGLWYTKDSGFELTGFSNVDYAPCKDTFKSTSDGAQFLGEKLVSWSSKKQDCTALSTAKAEYVSLSACCAQVLWMRTQLTDYGFHFNKILIYCDSKSAIAISCNPV